MTISSILSLPFDGKDFIVFFDASHSGLGIVLMQDRNMICYASRKLKTHEKIYTTQYLELEVIIFSLKFSNIVMDFASKFLYMIKKKI